MKKIIIEPQSLWDYYLTHEEELLTTMALVAENTVYGVDIYLTVERGCPCLVVHIDGYFEDQELCVSDEDCVETFERYASQYLSGDFLGEIPDEDEELSKSVVEDTISEREDELSDAIVAFIATALGNDFKGIDVDDLDNIFDDCKEHFLEYLARKHNVRVYRPMILEDEEDGEDFYAEYPYEHITFDDDNEIYKK